MTNQIRVHADSFRSHPGWWAVIEEPDIDLMTSPVDFVDSLSGKIILTGKVTDLVPPGTEACREHQFGDKAN